MEMPVSGWKALRLTHRGVTAALLVALASLLLTACSQKPAGAPPFELTNQSGQVVGLPQLRGKVVLLTFLYTHCPDTCPVFLSKIGQAITALGQEASTEIAVVAVTVDPERDTVERLRDYMAYFPPGWQFLTGTPGQLKTMWESYSIFVKREKPPPSYGSHQAHSGYLVTHTAKVVLIDREGRLRSELRGDWEVEELAARAKLPLAGKVVPSGGPLGSLAQLMYRCGPFVFSSIGDAIMFYLAMLVAPLTGMAAIYLLLWRQ